MVIENEGQRGDINTPKLPHHWRGNGAWYVILRDFANVTLVRKCCVSGSSPALPCVIYSQLALISWLTILSEVITDDGHVGLHPRSAKYSNPVTF